MVIMLNSNPLHINTYKQKGITHMHLHTKIIAYKSQLLTQNILICTLLLSLSLFCMTINYKIDTSTLGNVLLQV